MMKNSPGIPIDKTYKSIKTIFEKARSKSFKAVNTLMVQSYWHIGKVIVEGEQRGKTRAEYGEYLIKELSERLTNEFGMGFTISNLKYFRQFYLSFAISHAVRGQSQTTKGHALRDELTWTHYKCFLKVPSTEGKKGWVSPLGSSLRLGKNN